jgi:hypothetical protein
MILQAGASPQQSAENPYLGSIFEYGIVMESYSDDHTCKVRLVNGRTLLRVKVMPREWASKMPEGSDLAWSGRRDLPPKDTRVIILKPHYSYDGAVVIGSDFVYNGNYTPEGLGSAGAYDKPGEVYHITPGGWEYTEDRESGKITLKRGEFAFSASPKDEEGGGSLEYADINGNRIAVNADGIAVEDTNGNEVSASSGGIRLQDANGNKISTSSGGIVMEGRQGKLEIL